MNSAGSVIEKARPLLGRLAIAAFILAMPVFLVTTNVRMAFNSLQLYRFGFEQYNVEASTGLDMAQLMTVAADIRDYFNSSDELLDTRVVLNGEERALFNEREALHMRDVKGLVRLVYRLQVAAGAYLIVYAAVVLAVSGGRSARALAWRVVMGCLATVGLLAIGGLGSLVGFDQLFYQFHALSFAGGTWTFDPRYNYLTRLFTEGFFMQAALFIAVSAIAQALILMLAAWGVNRWVLGRWKATAGPG